MSRYVMHAPMVRGYIAPTLSWPRHLDGVSVRRHAPAAIYPRERKPSTHWIGGWAGITAGLEKEVRGKILGLCRESTPGRSVL
jgi:hypothetical protein